MIELDNEITTLEASTDKSSNSSKQLKKLQEKISVVEQKNTNFIKRLSAAKRKLKTAGAAPTDVEVFERQFRTELKSLKSQADTVLNELQDLVGTLGKTKKAMSENDDDDHILGEMEEDIGSLTHPEKQLSKNRKKPASSHGGSSTHVTELNARISRLEELLVQKSRQTSKAFSESFVILYIIYVSFCFSFLLFTFFISHFASHIKIKF